jgi:hypothetical protein
VCGPSERSVGDRAECDGLNCRESLMQVEMVSLVCELRDSCESKRVPSWWRGSPMQRAVVVHMVGE